jgi:hypothetical protein
MAFYKQLTAWDTSPFQSKQWFTALEDTILATDYFSRTGATKNIEFPPLGAIRYENAFMGSGVYKNVKVGGEAFFMWVWNNSGSDIAKGVPMAKRANQAVNNVTAGGVNYATLAATFTANKEVGGIVTVLDDGGAAGAAPEGQSGQIWKNDADTIYFQPDLTAALANTDDLIITYHTHVATGAVGLQLCDFRGVPVASGGIPNGYMGWACIDADFVDVLGDAAAGTVTIEKGLIATAGEFIEGSTSAVPLILGVAKQGLKTDTVNRHILASIGRGKMRGASA